MTLVGSYFFGVLAGLTTVYTSAMMKKKQLDFSVELGKY